MKCIEFPRKSRAWPVAMGLLLASTGLAAAPPVQSLAAIDAVVRQHIAANLEPESDIDVQVGRLDPRLRLANCDQALLANDARAGRDGAASSVEVRCDGSQPWSLYVPVTLVRFAEVVIAAHPLPRNAVVTTADLRLARRRVNPYDADYFTAVEQVDGQITARAIASGQTLGGSNIKRPQLVRRGDQVIVTSIAGSIKVSVQGRALENGSLGDRIEVQNGNSERVVEGEVAGAGVVVVRTAAVL